MNWSGMTDDLSAVCMEAFGTEVTYTPRIGVSFPLTAIFDASHTVIEGGGEVGIETVKPVLTVQNSDFEPLGRPAPQHEDEILINNKKYKVVGMEPVDEAETILVLMRAH